MTAEILKKAESAFAKAGPYASTVPVNMSGQHYKVARDGFGQFTIIG